MAHGWYDLNGKFHETATRAEATNAWRAERGYSTGGVYDMGGGDIVDTRGAGDGGESNAAQVTSLANQLAPEETATGPQGWEINQTDPYANNLYSYYYPSQQGATGFGGPSQYGGAAEALAQQGDSRYGGAPRALANQSHAADIQKLKNLQDKGTQTTGSGYDVQSLQSVTGAKLDTDVYKEFLDEQWYNDQTDRLIEERYESQPSFFSQFGEGMQMVPAATFLDPIRAFVGMILNDKSKSILGGPSFGVLREDKQLLYDQQLRKIQEAAVAGREASLTPPQWAVTDVSRQQTQATWAARETWAGIMAVAGQDLSIGTYDPGYDYQGKQGDPTARKTDGGFTEGKGRNQSEFISLDVATLLPVRDEEGNPYNLSTQEGWDAFSARMSALGYSFHPDALSGKGAFILDGETSPPYNGSTWFGAPRRYGYGGGGGGGGGGYGGYGSSANNSWQWRIRIT